VDIEEHENWNAFIEKEKPESLHFFSKFAKKSYTQVEYQTHSYLVFGSETTGLPENIHKTYADRMLIIPMRTHLVRSLNLAQAAAVVLYEAIRQNDFHIKDPDPAPEIKP
jgi:tRNA (cytidine/uridine-2'-O-)-methyltransferase